MLKLQIDIRLSPSTASGSVVDVGQDQLLSKQADVSTLKATFEAVTRIHYPLVFGRIAFVLVPCPGICSEAVTLLSGYLFIDYLFIFSLIIYQYFTNITFKS